MARRRALDAWQGNLFLPGGYDFAAFDAKRLCAGYLKRKHHEAMISGDAAVAAEAETHAFNLNAKIDWARAVYGSYQEYLSHVVRGGLGEDGKFDPKKNGTAHGECMRQTKRRGGMRR